VCGGGGKVGEEGGGEGEKGKGVGGENRVGGGRKGKERGGRKGEGCGKTVLGGPEKSYFFVFFLFLNLWRWTADTERSLPALRLPEADVDERTARPVGLACQPDCRRPG